VRGTGATGQYAHGSDPHTIGAPNSGAAFDAADAAARHAASERGHGRSTQSTDSSASDRLLYVPSGFRSIRAFASSTNTVPSAAENASASALFRIGHSCRRYSAEAIPLSSIAPLAG